MKFKVLSNDGMSLKPFKVFEIEAKNKQEAYLDLEENSSNNFGGEWIMNIDEFKNLKEVINNEIL
ncbi:MAG: hypothetical protein ACTSVV_03935 [Promethearchaeota archaeon]